VVVLDSYTGQKYPVSNTPAPPLTARLCALGGFFVSAPSEHTVGATYDKPALTFEQQVALLEERGLVVADRAKAQATLSRISYYRFSAYLYPFRAGDKAFRPGSSFDAALRLYELDRRLRLLVMDGIERAEVLARTHITYELAHARHPFAHGDEAAFEPGFAHEEWHESFLQELERAREEFLKHFRGKYDGYPRVPLWMASEVMSFGTLSKMFKGLQREHKANIARALGAHWRVAETWLHSLSYVRNVCAHHGRLWNRELAIRPALPSGDAKWLAVKAHRVYGVLCILRHLTTACHGGEAWAESARSLLSEYSAEPAWLVSMGAPVGWATHAFWKG
jgi:abortive infection bacteriophage resistance protein